MQPITQRTQDICRLVEDPSPNIIDRIEMELRKETYYLIEFLSRSVQTLPLQAKLELQAGLASLYICSRHKEQMAFMQDGVPFDWYLFERSLEGVAGIEKMNNLLNRALVEK